MNLIQFILNPMTPELYTFGNQSLHSVDVSPKMRRDLKMTLSAAAYHDWLAAVKACEALKEAAEATATELAELKATVEAAEAAAAEAAPPKKTGK